MCIADIHITNILILAHTYANGTHLDPCNMKTQPLQTYHHKAARDEHHITCKAESPWSICPSAHFHWNWSA